MPPRYPEEIAKLFKARPRPRFIKHEEQETRRGLTGLGAAISMLRDVKLPDVEPTPPILSVRERHALKREKAIQENNIKIEAEKAAYHPAERESEYNPYNTLFLCGIDESVTEQQIRYEFSVFGPIKSLKFVFDNRNGKRRPYCFLEYERADSFASAMNQGRRVSINGKHIIVDCERSHTVANWLPQRLGGGYGNNPRNVRQSKVMESRRNRRSNFKSERRYRIPEMSRYNRDDRYRNRRSRRYELYNI